PDSLPLLLLPPFPVAVLSDYTRHIAAPVKNYCWALFCCWWAPASAFLSSLNSACVGPSPSLACYRLSLCFINFHRSFVPSL
ncbi:hypothetical protein FB451DRAFT_1573258, partial [Mycena latifolia]